MTKRQVIVRYSRRLEWKKKKKNNKRRTRRYRRKKGKRKKNQSSVLCYRDDCGIGAFYVYKADNQVMMMAYFPHTLWARWAIRPWRCAWTYAWYLSKRLRKRLSRRRPECASLTSGCHTKRAMSAYVKLLLVNESQNITFDLFLPLWRYTHIKFLDYSPTPCVNTEHSTRIYSDD